MRNEILLESGTNDVGILEFYLGERGLGVDLAKIAQIIPYDDVQLTALPGDNTSIMGNLRWQDKQIPLIHLDEVLGRKS